MKKIIGITGGVGSGKSTVLSFLEKEYKAKVLIADRIGHTAFLKDSDTYRKIVNHFGEKILDEQGEVDHPTLAQIIFQDEKEKEFINSIIHPYALDKIKTEISIWKNDPERESIDPNLLIIETALMFETGCDKLCDEIWGVITDTNIRIDRLMKDRGYTEEKARSIIAAQISDEEIKNKCKVIVTNNTSIAETENQIRKLIDQIINN